MLEHEIDDWCCKSIPILGMLQFYSRLGSVVLVACSMVFVGLNVLHGAQDMIPMVSKILLASAFSLWVITSLLVEYVINGIRKFVNSLRKERLNHQVHSELLHRIRESKQVPVAVKAEIDTILNNGGHVTYRHLFILDEAIR